MKRFRGIHRQDPVPCGHFDKEELLKDAGDFIICENPIGEFGMHFMCPCGCGHISYVPIFKGPRGGDWRDPWGWDGNREAPTLSPSIEFKNYCKWHGFFEAGFWRDASCPIVT